MNLNHRHDHKSEELQQQQQKTTPLEFATPEELLRHDAANIDLPEAIAERLAESTANTPSSPWWKRWFAG